MKTHIHFKQTNIHFVDDTLLMAANIAVLQRMINTIGNASESNGLTLNTKITKLMIISKSLNNQGSL